MKALVLAAGYATRLYPLTLNFPKPLLALGSQTLLDHLIGQLEGIPAIERIFIVTNHQFLPHFEDWRRKRQAASLPASQRAIDLVDDGSTTHENRRGAIGDLHFTLQHAAVDDDLFVAAADNLLQFPLAAFVRAFQTKPAAHVCVHRVTDPERLRRTGVAVLDAEHRVVEFTEKPLQPKSQLAVPPIYLFPRATLGRVAQYLASGGSADAPGHFIEWLCRRETVYAYPIPGSILDIGTPESLAAARRIIS